MRPLPDDICNNEVATLVEADCITQLNGEPDIRNCYENSANCEKSLRVGGVSSGALSEEEKSMIEYPNRKQ